MQSIHCLLSIALKPPPPYSMHMHKHSRTAGHDRLRCCMHILTQGQDADAAAAAAAHHLGVEG